MKYMGSKSRIAQYIVPIIQQYIDSNNIESYLEPFIGGANVIDKIKCKNKYGSDKQKYLISLYQNLDKIVTLPEFVTKEHYSEVRECFNKDLHMFEDWYIGAIGFLASYNGRFFDGGYAGLVKTKIGTERNYYAEAKRNLEKQLEDLKGIVFNYSDYKDIEDISGYLIYCDPPYKDTKQYGVSKGFDYDMFWDWVREKSKENIVLISEQQAPKDFKSIWKQDVKRTVDNTKRVNVIENLFILENKI